MSNATTTTKSIGLVAGWGRYPIVVAEAIKRHGHKVYCAAIKDHADPVLQEVCAGFRWLGVAKFGGQLRFFRRNQVQHAVLAGKIFKDKVFFHGLPWIKHFPDLLCIRTLFQHLITKTKDMKDDTLLGAGVTQAAKHGVRFAPATDFAPELLVKNKTLTQRRVSRSEMKDIQFGWTLAHEMARLDVGQSVVIKGRVPIAVEALEGTDKCILRAGKLCPQGGLTVVKVAKPNQDMRFDVPTIGLGTLRTMVESGARVLAIEADKTIVLDESLVVDFANHHRITIVAVNESWFAQVHAAA